MADRPAGRYPEVRRWHRS